MANEHGNLTFPSLIFSFVWLLAGSYDLRKNEPFSWVHFKLTESLQQWLISLHFLETLHANPHLWCCVLYRLIKVYVSFPSRLRGKLITVGKRELRLERQIIQPYWGHRERRNKQRWTMSETVRSWNMQCVFVFTKRN